MIVDVVVVCVDSVVPCVVVVVVDGVDVVIVCVIVLVKLCCCD